MVFHHLQMKNIYKAKIIFIFIIINYFGCYNYCFFQTIHQYSFFYIISKNKNYLNFQKNRIILLLSVFNLYY